jgi:hypothetical protein
MDTESRSEPRQRRSSVPWVAISMTAGAAFAIVALTNAPGIAYVIVAIVAGLCYSLAGMYNRRRD